MSKNLKSFDTVGGGEQILYHVVFRVDVLLQLEWQERLGMVLLLQ